MPAESSTTSTATPLSQQQHQPLSTSTSLSSWNYYLVPLYIGWRIWWANRLPIMDCDEVFNYWEPLHYWLYGSGFQTWEYSNTFALRTYAYLIPLYGISKLYQTIVLPYIPNFWWPLLTNQSVILSLSSTVLGTSSTTVFSLGDEINNNISSSSNNNNKVALFVLLRATLAAAMAMAEITFCKAISEQRNSQKEKNASNTTYTVISWVTACLLLFSAGMSHASGAFLPSSTLTFLWLLASACYLRKQHLRFAILAIMATLGIGWPFGVLMFVPLGLGVLVREYHQESRNNRLWKFLCQIIVVTIMIQGMVMVIDYGQYEKWVSPVWNILIYNTKAGGDELYGVEPWSYYVKNLALNFNYITIGVLGILPALLFHRNTSLVMLLLPMYLWLAIVAPRPHKEERFLFPIYPCLCLGAATLSVSIVNWISQVVVYRNKATTTTIMKERIMSPSIIWQVVIWTPAILLSWSRTYALSKYYTAPLQVYSQLQQHHMDMTDAIICTCGEWYRFPSSFYLPSNSQSFGFVASSFDGQLPQPFTSHGSGIHHETTFNDQNKPQANSITLLDDCNYLIDLYTSTDCRENDSIWKPIAQAPFLDADQTSMIHRALYIPYWHTQEEETNGSVQYVDYILYQRQED